MTTNILDFTDIPNLYAYWNAADDTKVTAPGGVVSTVAPSFGELNLTATASSVSYDKDNIRIPSVQEDPPIVGLPAFSIADRVEGSLKSDAFPAPINPSALTVAVLFELDGTNTPGSGGPVVFRTALSNNNSHVRLYGSGSTTHWVWSDGGSNANTGAFRINAPQVIVLTVDPTTSDSARLWVDGVPAASFAFSGTASVMDAIEFLGRGGNYGMGGKMSIMCLYEHVFNDTEAADITELMNYWMVYGQGPSGPVPPGVTDPVSVEVTSPDEAMFSTTPSGSPFPTLLWEASANGVDGWVQADQLLLSGIPAGLPAGVTEASLRLYPTNATDNGKYVRVVGSSAAGPDAQSAAALLTVNPTPGAGTSTEFGPVLSTDLSADLKWQVSDAVDTAWYDVDDATGGYTGLESRGIQYSLEPVVPDGQSESQPDNQLNIDSALYGQTVYLQCKATTLYAPDGITSNQNTLIIEGDPLPPPVTLKEYDQDFTAEASDLGGFVHTRDSNATGTLDDGSVREVDGKDVDPDIPAFVGAAGWTSAAVGFTGGNQGLQVEPETTNFTPVDYTTPAGGGWYESGANMITYSLSAIGLGGYGITENDSLRAQSAYCPGYAATEYNTVYTTSGYYERRDLQYINVMAGGNERYYHLTLDTTDWSVTQAVSTHVDCTVYHYTVDVITSEIVRVSLTAEWAGGLTGGIILNTSGAQEPNGPSFPSYQGTEQGIANVYGVQIEAGETASSYIPTAGEAVTRSAVIARLDLSTTDLRQDIVGDFAFIVRGVATAPQSGIIGTVTNVDEATVWKISDGGLNYAQLLVQPSGATYLQVISDGVLVGSVGTMLRYNAGDTVDIRGSVSSVDGISMRAGVEDWVTSPTPVALGAPATEVSLADKCAFMVERVQVFQEAKTTAELSAMDPPLPPPAPVELINNATFAEGVTGWSTVAGLLSVASGQNDAIHIQRNSGQFAGQCYQQLSLEVGETYEIVVSFIRMFNGTYTLGVVVSDPTFAVEYARLDCPVSSTTPYTLQFIATASDVVASINPSQSIDAESEIGSFSIRKIS